MAIKFSQFVVQTNASALSHIVGYNGADNIQITPADFINSLVPGGPFLPLAGGTMTGDVIFGDGIVAKFGDGQDLRIQSIGNQGYIQNYTGDLQIQNRAVDKDILFRADDGAGGQTTYLTVDGANEVVSFQKDSKHEDNIRANFGNASDLQIYHNGSNSFISDTGTGLLVISTNTLQVYNAAVSEFMITATENGSVDLYYDNSKKFETTNTGVAIPSGQSVDFINSNLGYNAIKRNSILGGLEIRTGGVASVNILDNSNATFAGNVSLADSKQLVLGTSGNFNMFFNGSDTTLQNFTGDLFIVNKADDKDIIFQSDDGSGGLETYLSLDGSDRVVRPGRSFVFPDNISANFGAGYDLNIKHDGGNSYISQGGTGDLYIQQNVNDKDLVFQCDNGSGGTATYFFLDGSATQTTFQLDTKHNDNVKAKFGDSVDLEIYHDGTNNYIQGVTGDMYIQNGANDKDIIFRSDDGAGGQTTYFFLDGGNTFTNFQLNARWVDNAKAQFGNSGDMELYHDGNHSYVKSGGTGDLYIQQFRDDGDIVFQSDDGSGGMTQYFRVDGSSEKTIFSKEVLLNDGVFLKFGGSGDFEIYHDSATNQNKIKSNLGRQLLVNADSFVVNNGADSANLIIAQNTGSVNLYYSGSKKFETTNTGIKVTGVSEFADNTAAIAGGLTTGDVYRTGDLLKIVH